MASKKKRLPARETGGWLIALALVAIAAPVCFPLLTSQLPGGHDAFFYHPRLVEFHENIIHGNLLPRWAPDLEIGAGQPLFDFTPPLPYYVAEFWHLIGFDSIVAFNLAAIAAILASAFFMFLFAEYHFGRKPALLAAAAYLYAPYFHVDVFVRHAFAEFMAFPFYPLSLYGFSRYAREGRAGFLAVGAVAWSGILLTHNPSALLFAPLLLLGVGFIAWREQPGYRLIKIIAGLIVGTALAACIWIPALMELPSVYIERSLQGTTQYADHFVYPGQLLSRTWGYGLSVAGPDDQLSFSLGWGHILLLALAAWLVFTDKNRTLRAWFIFLGSILVILALLMTPFSKWLWDSLPLLQQVQFPWRLLADAVFVTAILSAVYGACLTGRTHAAIGFWGGLALLILPNLSHIGPEKNYPLNPAEWVPAAISQNAVETTANGEFEPRWVQRRMPFTDQKASVVRGSAMISSLQVSPTFWTMRTEAMADAAVEAVLLYFPGWMVSVDGARVPVEIADTGRIRFHAPAGSHQVSIEFKRTRTRFVAETISVLALVVGFAALLMEFRKPRFRP